jgi:hypothetical protein
LCRITNYAAHHIRKPFLHRTAWLPSISEFILNSIKKCSTWFLSLNTVKRWSTNVWTYSGQHLRFDGASKTDLTSQHKRFTYRNSRACSWQYELFVAVLCSERVRVTVQCTQWPIFPQIYQDLLHTFHYNLFIKSDLIVYLSVYAIL